MNTSALNANVVKEKENKGPPNADKNKKEEARLIKKLKKELNDFELIKKSNTERFLLISEETSTIHASLSCQSIFTPPAKAPHVNEDE